MPDKDDLFPEAERNNYVTVRIGGYQTSMPLSDVTDEALGQIAEPNWHEIGARFLRAQRAAPRV